jgi:hypothetical protein
MPHQGRRQSSHQELLWTIVNRGGLNTSGPQLHLDAADFSSADYHFYDCYHGAEVHPAVVNGAKGAAVLELSFEIEATGYGCILATTNATNSTAHAASALSRFLSEMKTMTARALSSYRKEWRFELQHIVQRTRTPGPNLTVATTATTATTAATATTATAPGMVLLPRGVYRFVTSGVEVEGDDEHGVDVQYPFEMTPRRSHDQLMTVPSLWMDRYPVTCAAYRTFILESEYRGGNDIHNWLRNWKHESASALPSSAPPPSFPPGYGSKPVTYVSLGEASAYCAHYGKRLPQVMLYTTMQPPPPPCCNRLSFHASLCNLRSVLVA